MEPPVSGLQREAVRLCLIDTELDFIRELLVPFAHHRVIAIALDRNWPPKHRLYRAQQERADRVFSPQHGAKGVVVSQSWPRMVENDWCAIEVESREVDRVHAERSQYESSLNRVDIVFRLISEFLECVTIVKICVALYLTRVLTPMAMLEILRERVTPRTARGSS